MFPSHHGETRACRVGWRRLPRALDRVRKAKDTRTLGGPGAVPVVARSRKDVCRDSLVVEPRSGVAAKWLGDSTSWRRRVSLSMVQRPRQPVAHVCVCDKSICSSSVMPPIQRKQKQTRPSPLLLSCVVCVCVWTKSDIVEHDDLIKTHRMRTTPPISSIKQYIWTYFLFERYRQHNITIASSYRRELQMTHHRHHSICWQYIHVIETTTSRCITHQQYKLQNNYLGAKKKVSCKAFKNVPSVSTRHRSIDSQKTHMLTENKSEISTIGYNAWVSYSIYNLTLY